MGVESQQFDFLLMYHSLISLHVIFGNPAQKKQPLLFFFHANLITSHTFGYEDRYGVTTVRLPNVQFGHPIPYKLWQSSSPQATMTILQG